MNGPAKSGQMMVSRKALIRGMGAAGALALFGRFGILPHEAFAQDQGGTPQPGGIMTLNLTADPPNFDSLSGSSSTIMNVIAPCYNGLVRYDPQDPNRIIPDLATSWEVSPDGKTYTFALVTNARFHDGKPMTSADAKYTFDVIRNPPDGTVSSRKNQLAVVDTIEAPDDHTIRFVLKQPSPSFLANLASCWMLVLPKHILEVKGNMKENIIGTGPFMLKEYKRGVSVELIKNTNYHVPDRPYLDGIKAFVIPDTGTTWNYLRSGQLLWFVSIQGQDAGALKAGGKVVVQESPSTSFIGAVFNTKAAPFDNILVRKAASLAIDRQAALQVTYNGQGQMGGVSVPGPWELPKDQLQAIPGYGVDTGANLAEAKKLLAEAGHPDGLAVKMLVRKNPLFEPVGVFLKDQWAKIGIRATIDIQENAAFFSSLSKHEFQVCANGGSYAISDPDSVFGDYFTCAGSQNHTNMCQPAIDTLFDEQSRTMDPAARLKLVNELEEKVLEEYGIYVMYWRNRFMGMSNRVRGLKIHPNIDQNMRLEDVWLSA